MEEIEIKDLNAYQQQSEEPRAQKYAALHHNLLDSQMVAWKGLLFERLSPMN